MRPREYCETAGSAAPKQPGQPSQHAAEEIGTLQGLPLYSAPLPRAGLPTMGQREFRRLPLVSYRLRNPADAEDSYDEDFTDEAEALERARPLPTSTSTRSSYAR